MLAFLHIFHDVSYIHILVQCTSPPFNKREDDALILVLKFPYVCLLLLLLMEIIGKVLFLYISEFSNMIEGKSFYKGNLNVW